MLTTQLSKTFKRMKKIQVWHPTGSRHFKEWWNGTTREREIWQRDNQWLFGLYIIKDNQTLKMANKFRPSERIKKGKGREVEYKITILK